MNSEKVKDGIKYVILRADKCGGAVNAVFASYTDNIEMVIKVLVTKKGEAISDYYNISNRLRSPLAKYGLKASIQKNGVRIYRPVVAAYSDYAAIDLAGSNELLSYVGDETKHKLAKLGYRLHVQGGKIRMKKIIKHTRTKK